MPRNKLRETIRGKLAFKQDAMPTQLGILGDRNGTVAVPDRPGYVFARVNDVEMQVYSAPGIAQLPGLAVVIGYRPEMPGLLQVLSAATSGAIAGQGTGAAIGKHRTQHEWPHADAVMIDERQITPLRISPVEGFTVTIFDGFVWLDNYLSYVHLASPIDLSSYVPTTSGKTRLVWFVINDSGVVITVAGAEVNLADLNTSVTPTFSGVKYVLGAVRLYYGQTQIWEGLDSSDVLDLRFPVWHRHASSTLVNEINRIKTYHVADGSVEDFDVTALGLTTALAHAADNDTVALPNCSLTGNFSVPAHVFLSGNGSVIYGWIQLHNLSRVHLLLINNNANDASDIACIYGPASGLVYISDCSLYANQQGSGRAAGIEGAGGDLIVYNTPISGVSAGGNGYGYYTTYSGIFREMTGTLQGSTSCFQALSDSDVLLSAVQTSPDIKGRPLPSDRAAWDAVGYPELHAKDLSLGTPMYHAPLPGLAGEVLTSDGSKWTSAQAAGAPREILQDSSGAILYDDNGLNILYVEVD